MQLIPQLTLAFALLSAVAEGSPVLRTADALQDAAENKTADRGFDLTARIIVAPTYHRSPFHAVCGSRVLAFSDIRANRLPMPTLGDVVRLTGLTAHDPENGEFKANVTNLNFLAHDAVPPSEPCEAPLLGTADLSHRHIAIRGTIRDVVRDDIDENYCQAYLECSNGAAYVSCGISGNNYESIRSLIGTEVLATGVGSGLNRTSRRYPRQYLFISGTNHFKVLKRQVPSQPQITADRLRVFSPTEIAAAPPVSMCGRVLAVWGRNEALLRDTAGSSVRISLRDEDLPPVGTSIEVVGNPETDLFNLSLTRASWRTTEPLAVNANRIQDLPIKDLFQTSRGQRIIQTRAHGKVLRLNGTVKGLLVDEQGCQRLLVSDGSHVLSIVCGAGCLLPDSIREGCEIEITGLCVLESDCWRPHAVFPKVKGLFLVLRTADDIHILSQPSWWTPTRSLSVIGVLFAFLVTILMWNRSLKRLAEHRGREIARGEIKRTASELKVYERTRLAVELHDSVAQNLTGASMEIRAAKRAKDEDDRRLDEHLDLAAATLDSCRNELRNCIWDLRHLALDETTVDEALRRTLGPHLGEVRLSLRFNVPRKRFSDNMIHTVLRIIRELVINGIRHGRATEIKVAGCLDGSRLRFSVSDNGCGFVPELAPGMERGHFGLEGIRDRVALFDGSLMIDSRPGKGTKAVISLELTNP